MSTLLIRLAGPMQSWGTQSRFTVRDTGLEPSKSGVIGVVCAALGRHRTESVADLASLKMGVRVDKEGKMERDYHTTLDVIKASGTMPPKGQAVTSDRYYLADADFLVGLEGDSDLLGKVHDKLKDPVWNLFLGRKAFPPAEPVWLGDGLKEDSRLEDTLRNYPIPPRSPSPNSDQVRLVLEVSADEAESVRVDHPLSFSERRFVPRYIKTIFILRESLPKQKEV